MSQSLTSQSLTSQSLLDKFDVSPEDLSLLKECGKALANKIDRVVDRFYEWLREQPEFNVFFSSQDTVERVKRLQKVYWADFFQRRRRSALCRLSRSYWRDTRPARHAKSDLFRGDAALPAAFHGRASGK